MNKYDVLGVVGEGAYGVVLKCKNKDSNEVVAIKKFKESEEDEVVRKTTLREVKILRIMRHENIVQLREAFRRKGKLYLVFEFVEKSMLDILEANPNGVGTETVRVLTCQLARATEYCHRHDVIHRDIKPENLLINPADNALRLCDFGFARTMTADSPLTDYVATRWYRAPELLLGSTHYGKDVDIWALGCIMGELTDGQPLFAGESEVDQLFVIQKVMGPLTPEHMEMFLRNPRFLGIQFPDVSRPETLEKRYVRRMPKLQMMLLKGVLVMEPRRRLTARDVLRMPWFENIKLPRSLRPPSQSQSRMRPDSSSSVANQQQPDRGGGSGAGNAPQSRGSQGGGAGGGAALQHPEPPVAQSQPLSQIRESVPAPREQAQHPPNPWSNQVPEPSEPRGPREDPRLLREEEIRRSSQREDQTRGAAGGLVAASSQGRGSDDHLRTTNSSDLRGGGGGAGGHPHHRDDMLRSIRGDDPRMQHPGQQREDPRLMFEDPRVLREANHGPQPGVDPRLHRDVDPRAAYRNANAVNLASSMAGVSGDDSGSSAQLGRVGGNVPSRGEDPRLQPRGEDLRLMHRGGQEDPRLQREDPRGALVQPQHHQHQLPSRPHPYVLPWEDSTPEDGPPADFVSSSSLGPSAGNYGEPDDKGAGDGRRSRQRRQGNDAVGANAVQGDWCDPRLPSDRGTPNNADRGGAPFGFNPNLVGQSALGGLGGAAGVPPKATRNAAVGSGPAIGFGAGMISSGGAMPNGGFFGMSPPSAGLGGSTNFPPGASSHGGGAGHGGGVGMSHASIGQGHVGHAVSNGSGCSGGIGEGVSGDTRHNAPSGAMRHGVSAGTGGSEEWPSTQGKAVRQMREPDTYDDEKTLWAQQGLPKRKGGRQPGALGAVPPAPPARRSPELADSWQEPSRHEAWRGEAGPDMHAGLGGLPSIHGGFLAGPQGVGHGDGSVGSSRWGPPGVPPGAGGAVGDWPGLGPSPAELGPVRDNRGPLNEARTPQHQHQHDSRTALGTLRGRPDLSGVHYGH